MLDVRVKRLSPSAVLPTYATDGAGCFDLHSDDSGHVYGGSACAFGTGLAFEVPDGHVMLIFSRSGHAAKNGVRLGNCVGVVDSDYRGEVRVILRNDTTQAMTVSRGDRIAQALIVPVPRVALIEADELSETVRGTGGFGSTGR